MGNRPTTLRPSTDQAAVQYLTPHDQASDDYDTVLDFALAHEKVVGFFGDEGIKSFDSLMENGSLVRAGALPHTLVDLLGPILQSLDGQEYDTTRAALVRALSGTQLELYKPVLSREMVFKVVLALVFGVDVQHDQSELHHQVDAFLQSMRKSLGHADSQAKAQRDKLVESLVVPALNAARNRVAQGKAKSCLVDALVAEKQLDDQVVRAQVFNLFVNGFSGIDSMVINSITAMCVYPDVHGKLVVARDACTAKYSSVEDRWNHLDDLGYIQRFLKEVTRVYVAGTTHVYGRATRSVDVTVSNGKTFELPKGPLATAILDAPTWADASTFNPDRFLKQVHIELPTDN
ncbi:hypothetical protein AC1031_009870 [Aphanomyces cochlioides]|nr:hypothetical protein AC1031_009870 [Aphanomyces cochlioides]